MEGPQVAQVLKRDVFGAVELLEGPAGAVVRRVARGGRLPASGLIARALLRRERRALARVEGMAGVPRLLSLADYAGVPSDGAPVTAPVLLRSFLAGVPLQETEVLAEDFFDRLLELVAALHAHGVCHNDLHKEPNVLVGPDGRPALIDFQLASVHRRRGALFESRVREDVRHVLKHRARYERRGAGAGASAEDARPVPRRSFLAAAWMRLGKPAYNLVTRRLLGTSDGEPRRPSAGPWPRWGPPVGPRSPADREEVGQ